VADLDGLPSDDLPEVAFIGRSNVGKSSTNALANRAPGLPARLRPHPVDQSSRWARMRPVTCRMALGAADGAYAQQTGRRMGVGRSDRRVHHGRAIPSRRGPPVAGLAGTVTAARQTQRKPLVLLSKVDKLTSEQGRTLQAVQRTQDLLPGEARLPPARPAGRR
jgi:hypothetical protein